jgi:hypothetical protein
VRWKKAMRPPATARPRIGRVPSRRLSDDHVLRGCGAEAVQLESRARCCCRARRASKSLSGRPALNRHERRRAALPDAVQRQPPCHRARAAPFPRAGVPGRLVLPRRSRAVCRRRRARRLRLRLRVRGPGAGAEGRFIPSGPRMLPAHGWRQARSRGVSRGSRAAGRMLIGRFTTSLQESLLLKAIALMNSRDDED